MKENENIIEQPNALTFTGRVSYDDWMKKGQSLTHVVSVWNNHLRWWIGDWLVYGEQMFPDRYTQACDASLYDVGSLRNASWVCRNVPPENRRNELSFEHHAQVASIKNSEEQRRWLQLAVEENLNVRELRKSIKAGQVVKFSSAKEQREAIEAKSEDKPEAEEAVENLTGEGSDELNQCEGDAIAGSDSSPSQSFDEWWAENRESVVGLLLYDACRHAWEGAMKCRKG